MASLRLDLEPIEDGVAINNREKTLILSDMFECCFSLSM